MNAAAASTLEARPGSTVESPAIVLSATPYQETGKIVHLMTPEFGKVTLFAAGAAVSRKRFGAALEPMNFVQAQMRIPRETGGAPVMTLLKADLRDSFLHLRTHTALLETGAFAVKFIDEFIPEGQSDAVVFRAIGRFLRDSAKLADPNMAIWCRLAFWNWMSRHFGFGDLIEASGLRAPQMNANLRGAWDRLMAESEADFGRFFGALSQAQPPRLHRRDETAFYAAWTESTGLHWTHFEQWMRSYEVSL